MTRQIVTVAAALCLVAVQSATAQSVDVPEWAKEAVWYQIFPERFRNGDPHNDPTPADLQGAWPHLVPDGWKISDWTSDWYDPEDWERATGKPFYVTCQIRRYGGDLQGMLDKLDYLQSLGVTALYLNPMFDAPSLHKYDGSLYHHIDCNFGADPAGDRKLIAAEIPHDPRSWQWTAADTLFLKFVREAHHRGIKVILDGVFNHLGTQSFAFRDLRLNQQRSRYRDWFEVKQWDDPATAESEFDYAGWLGVRELPELKEDDRGLVPPVRDYVFAAVRRWMDPDGNGDPEDGIDGWRLDVAEHVRLAFWRDFRSHVRRINPQAYLVGEVWWQDWPRFQMFNARPWLEGDAFDAVMNYRWASAARKLFLEADRQPGEAAGPGQFFKELARLHADYPAEVNYVLMNTYDSHDTDRLASQVVNRNSLFDHRVCPNDDPAYDVRKPLAAERQLQRLMLIHQFTTVGAPHIYYGDEAGMWGADDPDARKPMLWDDLEFASESAHPLGRSRPRDAVEFDRALFDFYRKLISLRRSHRALSRGDFRPILADDSAGTLAYERRFGQDRVWVVFNLSDATHTVTLPCGTSATPTENPTDSETNARELVDPLSDVTQTISGPEAVFNLPPRSARVWVWK